MDFEQLIKNNKIIEALSELDEKLNKSFDLSVEKERTQYVRLKEWQEKANSFLAQGVCEKLNKKDRVRSTESSVVVRKVVPSDINSFLQASRYIGAGRYDKLAETGMKQLIYILYTLTPSEELAGYKLFPSSDRLKKFKTGDQFPVNITDSKIMHVLIGQSASAEDDRFLVTQGLTQVIDNLFLEGYENISLVVDFTNGGINSAQKRVYYHLILLVVLYKIIQYSKDLKPFFEFLFQNENELALFRAVSMNYTKEEPVKQVRLENRSELVESFAERCLTQDNNYKKMLSSLLYILDEDDIPILIQGESGVGKSYLARLIHEFSNRKDKPFQEVNCGTLIQEKLDQKLWGWKKGSFTGANSDYEGLVKRAEGGTLFLDEIHNATAEVRFALLTFIETKRYEVLGGKKTETGNVNLIFGSNKDLKGYIKRGKFEGDLYTRISGRVIKIPALRERVADIDMMIDRFLTDLNHNKQSMISIEKDARTFLKSYSWPWNTRELNKAMKIVFLDALASNHTTITKQMVENYPFDALLPTKMEDFENLVELIKAFLSNWDGEQGAFLDEVLAPILSKVYFDDCFKHMSKEQKWKKSSDLIGISGVNHNTSTLKREYDKFESVKVKLGLT